MQKTANTSKSISLILTLFTIALIYGVFRFTFGGYFLSKLDGSVTSLSNNMQRGGAILTEISTTSVANNQQGSKSNLISDSYNLYLNGNTGIKTSNPKVLAMQKFLSDYNSPMYPYASEFINQADKYGLDWRLVASISGVESAFGNLIPRNTNNGWGWRGGPGGAYSIFPTWKEGIETVTRGLANGYGTTVTPFQIEVRYCPPCYANPAHAWANGVTKFMNELSFYLDNLENM